MTPRIHPLLLFVAVLVALNSCSTTGSRPVVESPAQTETPAQTKARDRERLDLLQRDPSERSLAEVIELSKKMTGYQPDLALEILRSLESVPSGQLVIMIDSQIYDPEFTEWLELALEVRSVLINGSSPATAAQKWANYHYGHVITRANFPALVASYGKLYPVPDRVAVLLPARGGLAAAAKAIRDGILSAYLEQPGESVIRFYSSGENSESAIAAYLQAREEGATQIVGPLRIESTRALASLDYEGVPILLLNESGSDKESKPGQSPAVNSLSLSQTEEAVAIARRALAQGQKHAIVILPDSDWGTRMGTAFAVIYEQDGGHISATSRFDTATGDHGAMLTRLLRIDESEQRKTDLQSRLGISLDFEPSRRDDFDFIFLAASPEEGRQIKPLLRFHDAGDVPVYAMGRVFSGKLDDAIDQDLNGIVFPTTPWQLAVDDGSSPLPDSIRGGAFGNLYALGLDAWRLLPWLPLMQKDPDLWFPGEIGALRLLSNGQLYRQPAWAQFSAGLPIAYQWPGNH